MARDEAPEPEPEYDPTAEYLCRERRERERDAPGFKYFPEELLHGESELGVRLNEVARAKADVIAQVEVFIEECRDLLRLSKRCEELSGEKPAAVKDLPKVYQNYLILMTGFNQSWRELLTLTKQGADFTHGYPEKEINDLVTKIDNTTQRFFAQFEHLRTIREQLEQEYARLAEVKAGKKIETNGLEGSDYPE